MIKFDKVLYILEGVKFPLAFFSMNAAALSKAQTTIQGIQTGGGIIGSLFSGGFNVRNQKRIIKAQQQMYQQQRQDEQNAYRYSVQDRRRAGLSTSEAEQSGAATPPVMEAPHHDFSGTQRALDSASSIMPTRQALETQQLQNELSIKQTEADVNLKNAEAKAALAGAGLATEQTTGQQLLNSIVEQTKDSRVLRETLLNTQLLGEIGLNAEQQRLVKKNSEYVSTQLKLLQARLPFASRVAQLECDQMLASLQEIWSRVGLNNASTDQVNVSTGEMREDFKAKQGADYWKHSTSSQLSVLTNEAAISRSRAIIEDWNSKHPKLRLFGASAAGALSTGAIMGLGYMLKAAAVRTAPVVAPVAAGTASGYGYNPATGSFFRQ